MPYIDIHTHDPSAGGDVIKVVSVFPGEEVIFSSESSVVYTAGLHPWHIEKADMKNSINRIEEWLVKGSIKGVGETGLDSLRGPGIRLQQEVFIEHIRISEEYDCPLIVHCVKTYNEILNLRRSSKAKQPWILHGFNSSVQMMRQMTESGIFISLGPALLKNKKLWNVCSEVPDNFLFLETDVSDADIKDIYAKAAEFRGIGTEELKQIIFKNYNSIFK
jgi:TatD DNase family protein